VLIISCSGGSGSV